MNDFKQKALDYHQKPKPGKISIQVTKSFSTQTDLSMAYSPGVAEPCLEIQKNPNDAYLYTNKSNLLGIISNGTAVLGLGDIGALASKPVMEGKSALFKKFSGIDVYDIELDSKNIDEFVQTVVNIAPTFGGIVLEDIAAPACFEIEQKLIERLKIPVFHDDQHGTAIIIVAGLLNALEIQGKTIETARIVCIGAGSAGIASLNLLCDCGAKRENIVLIDREGVIRKDNHALSPHKAKYATDLDLHQLDDAIESSDVFIGLAAANLLTEPMVKKMAPNPIIFALSNPNPEINPNLAQTCRPDAIVATGRSDYPNQVNNVLCFPFLFRGALDVHACQINLEMKKAFINGLVDLAKQPVIDEVKKIYADENLVFGKNYILPKPFDPRLIQFLPQMVAKAAIESGAAQK